MIRPPNPAPGPPPDILNRHPDPVTSEDHQRMTSRCLPADGTAIWRVTSAGRTRWLRIRRGARPAVLPDGAGAEQISLFDADELVAGAPRWLRHHWRLAQADGWGWTVQQLRSRDGGVACWSLTVEDPAGAVQWFSWVAGSGGRMPDEPVAQGAAGPGRS
jgi:hypothetical protein